MNLDEEFDDEYDEDINHDTAGDDQPGGFDPLDINDPKSAYFSLSDDVQDELQGTDKKKMKCHSCGHRFVGEIYDGCPECYSANTEELIEFENFLKNYWLLTGSVKHLCYNR